jgi:hypothetical protein
VIRLCIIALAAITGAPTTRSYGFDAGVKRLSPDKTEVRIFSRSTGRTVWAKQLLAVYRLQWSGDRKAVAIIEDAVGVRREPYRLYIWREGSAVLTFDDLPGWETVQDVLWSADKHRLVFRAAASMGEADQGFGRLWCLNLTSRTFSLIPGGDVTRAKWISPRRLRYWTGKYVLPRPGADRAILRETAHEAVCK